ncbi:hypothetical protein PG984_005409 [Apiospora sp. TS-2023a]
MTRTSEQSVYGGATPSKPSRIINEKPNSSESSKTPKKSSESKKSKKSISKGKVDSYMSTVNEGGDPVTAISLRPGIPTQSAAKRLARVESEMAKALGKL